MTEASLTFTAVDRAMPLVPDTYMHDGQIYLVKTPRGVFPAHLTRGRYTGNNSWDFSKAGRNCVMFRSVIDPGLEFSDAQGWLKLNDLEALSINE